MPKSKKPVKVTVPSVVKAAPPVVVAPPPVKLNPRQERIQALRNKFAKLTERK